MGRGKLLSSEEMAQIRVLKEQGLSNRQIAKCINRSPTVVDNYIKLKENYNTKKSTGAPPRISKRQKNNILQEARRNKLSAAQICHKLELPIRKRRVQKILQDSPNLVWEKKIKKPPLTPAHKAERLVFAQSHMSWKTEWQQVVFSDEKKFNLDGPDGCHYYWHDLRDKKEVRMSRNFGGGSVMIWAAFSFSGKTPVFWVPRRMNAEIYLDILEIALDTFQDDLGGPDFTFQQDNAAVHRARKVKEWFTSTGTRVLPWPSRSPDLNPIENLWGIVVRRVYANGKQYDSVPELKEAIKIAWNSIETSILENLINSMSQRIFEVIKNNGGATAY